METKPKEMNKTVRGCLIAFAVGIMGMFILTAVVSVFTSRAVNVKEEDQLKESTVLTQAQKDSIANMNIQKKKEISDRVDKLKKNFLVEKDEIRNLEFYTHKTFGKYWPQRITLTAGVNSEGYSYLRSNYHADDWIFHESVTVKTDNQVYTTAIVSRYDKNNRTDVNNGVYEVVTYPDERPLLMHIAMNTDQRILVRFNGPQYYKDIVLSDRDKKALSETFYLAMAITELREVK